MYKILVTTWYYSSDGTALTVLTIDFDTMISATRAADIINEKPNVGAGVMRKAEVLFKG